MIEQSIYLQVLNPSLHNVRHLNDCEGSVENSDSLVYRVICATRMYRSLILYDMDVYGTPLTSWLMACWLEPVRDKYSDGPDNIGSLRFGASPTKGTVTGTGTGTSSATATTDRFDPTFVPTKDSENSLAEKPAAIGDEALSHNVLSLLVHDDSHR